MLNKKRCTFDSSSSLSLTVFMTSSMGRLPSMSLMVILDSSDWFSSKLSICGNPVSSAIHLMMRLTLLLLKKQAWLKVPSLLHPQWQPIEYQLLRWNTKMGLPLCPWLVSILYYIMTYTGSSFDIVSLIILPILYECPNSLLSFLFPLGYSFGKPKSSTYGRMGVGNEYISLMYSFWVTGCSKRQMAKSSPLYFPFLSGLYWGEKKIVFTLTKSEDSKSTIPFWWG